jgi:hypothetical protein
MDFIAREILCAARPSLLTCHHMVRGALTNGKLPYTVQVTASTVGILHSAAPTLGVDCCRQATTPLARLHSQATLTTASPTWPPPPLRPPSSSLPLAAWRSWTRPCWPVGPRLHKAGRSTRCAPSQGRSWRHAHGRLGRNKVATERGKKQQQQQLHQAASLQH